MPRELREERCTECVLFPEYAEPYTAPAHHGIRPSSCFRPSSWQAHVERPPLHRDRRSGEVARLDLGDSAMVAERSRDDDAFAWLGPLERHWESLCEILRTHSDPGHNTVQPHRSLDQLTPAGGAAACAAPHTISYKAPHERGSEGRSVMHEFDTSIRPASAR